MVARRRSFAELHLSGVGEATAIITHIGTAQEYFVGVTSTIYQILLRNDTACDDTEQCGRLSKGFVYVIKTALSRK